MIAAAVAATLLAAVTPSPLLTWSVAASIPGVFDVVGPRADGHLVVAAGGKLFLFDTQSGAVAPFAAGPDGYSGRAGEEAYVALAPADQDSTCPFTRDDLYVLELRPAGGITRVDANGAAHHFADVPGVDSLNGIVFDTQGRFDHRLLVTGPHGSHTTIAAVDCHGSVTVLTSSAPVMEGGLAVAPAGFGGYAGDLIGTDELSGTIYAVSANGAAGVMARPDLASGQDTGVEGAGFVPSAPVSGMTAYFADRATPGNPHVGSDHLLAVTGVQLVDAGVRPGDLLVATEGGAGMVGVRCASSCSWYPVIADNAVSHGEGHVLVIAGATASLATVPALARRAPSPRPPVAAFAALAAAVLASASLIALAITRRRRASRGPSQP